jgi:hypothetical protein
MEIVYQKKEEVWVMRRYKDTQGEGPILKADSLGSYLTLMLNISAPETIAETLSTVFLVEDDSNETVVYVSEDSVAKRAEQVKKIWSEEKKNKKAKKVGATANLVRDLVREAFSQNPLRENQEMSDPLAPTMENPNQVDNSLEKTLVSETPERDQVVPERVTLLEQEERCLPRETPTKGSNTPDQEISKLLNTPVPETVSENLTVPVLATSSDEQVAAFNMQDNLVLDHQMMSQNGQYIVNKDPRIKQVRVHESECSSLVTLPELNPLAQQGVSNSKDPLFSSTQNATAGSTALEMPGDSSANPILVESLNLSINTNSIVDFSLDMLPADMSSYSTTSRKRRASTASRDSLGFTIFNSRKKLRWVHPL